MSIMIKYGGETVKQHLTAIYDFLVGEISQGTWTIITNYY